MAEALRNWLPDVIQACEPWISSTDIDAGARWSSDLSKQLERTQFGIICLTPENMNEPWIYFEAGAISKILDDTTRLCPYLLGLGPTDVKGPFVQFQAVNADRTDTKRLVQAVNRALGTEALPEERIDRIFDRFWPQLDEKIKEILAGASEYMEPKRPDEDKLDEILKIVREQSRQLSNIRPVTLSQEDTKRDAIIAAMQSPELMDLILRQSEGEQIDSRKFLNALIDKPDIAKAILKAVPFESKTMRRRKTETK